MQVEAPLTLGGLLVKPASQPEATLPALQSCGGKAMPGLLCQVPTNRVSSVPMLDVQVNCGEDPLMPWTLVKKSRVVTLTSEVRESGIGSN